MTNTQESLSLKSIFKHTSLHNLINNQPSNGKTSKKSRFSISQQIIKKKYPKKYIRRSSHFSSALQVFNSIKQQNPHTIQPIFIEFNKQDKIVRKFKHINFLTKEQSQHYHLSKQNQIMKQIQREKNWQLLCYQKRKELQYYLQFKIEQKKRQISEKIKLKEQLNYERCVVQDQSKRLQSKLKLIQCRKIVNKNRRHKSQGGFKEKNGNKAIIFKKRRKSEGPIERNEERKESRFYNQKIKETNSKDIPKKQKNKSHSDNIILKIIKTEKTFQTLNPKNNGLNNNNRKLRLKSQTCAQLKKQQTCTLIKQSQTSSLIKNENKRIQEQQSSKQNLFIFNRINYVSPAKIENTLQQKNPKLFQQRQKQKKYSNYISTNTRKNIELKRNKKKKTLFIDLNMQKKFEEGVQQDEFVYLRRKKKWASWKKDSPPSNNHRDFIQKQKSCKVIQPETKKNIVSGNTSHKLRYNILKKIQTELASLHHL